MPAQGALAQMIEQGGGSKSLVKEAQRVESMPGGPELLFTVAAEEMMDAQGIPKKDAKKLRLYKMGGYASANPYPKSDKRHAQWNDKYASKGYSKRGNKDIPETVFKARGGKMAAAETTRQAGRGDDSMLLHMSPEEYEAITAMWGEPDINPNTGIPEYGFLSKVWKKIKKGVKKIVKSKAFRIIAPIALSVFAPGLGTFVGAKLGLGTGLLGQAAGNAIVRGGLGAVTGGKEGAIKGAFSGAVAGGLGAAVGDKIQNVAPQLGDRTATALGSALVRGTGSKLAGEDFTSGAIAGGLESYMSMGPDQMAKSMRAAGADPDAVFLGPKEALGGIGETFTGLAAGQAGPPLPLAQGAAKVAGKYGVPALMTAAALSAPDYEEPEPPDWARDGGGDFGGGFGESLPVYTMNRQFRGLSDPASYFTYGQPGAPHQGQHLFITPSEPFPGDIGPLAPPQAGVAPGALEDVVGRGRGAFGAVGMGQGGSPVSRADYWQQNEDVPNTIPTVSRRGGHQVNGPGTGRSDDIPAMLSDGEYVIDAESVALLGDGSGDAGARRLDEMRRNLRKHKAKNLKKGEFTHKAKTPEGYMPKKRKGGSAKMRRLRATRKGYEHGGVHNVSGAGPTRHLTAAGGNA